MVQYMGYIVPQFHKKKLRFFIFLKNMITYYESIPIILQNTTTTQIIDEENKKSIHYIII